MDGNFFDNVDLSEFGGTGDDGSMPNITPKNSPIIPEQNIIPDMEDQGDDPDSDIFMPEDMGSFGDYSYDDESGDAPSKDQSKNENVNLDIPMDLDGNLWDNELDTGWWKSENIPGQDRSFTDGMKKEDFYNVLEGNDRSPDKGNDKPVADMDMPMQTEAPRRPPMQTAPAGPKTENILKTEGSPKTGEYKPDMPIVSPEEETALKNIIQKGWTIQGDISMSGQVIVMGNIAGSLVTDDKVILMGGTIDGSITAPEIEIVEGKIKTSKISSGRVTVQKGGKISGSVSSDEVIVFGKIKGSITAHTVILNEDSMIEGDIAASLIKAEGGKIRCVLK